MTWKMSGIVRRTWDLPRSSSARCTVCAWKSQVRMSSSRSTRIAREHTRRTGHVTRAARIRVTEYEVA